VYPCEGRIRVDRRAIERPGVQDDAGIPHELPRCDPDALEAILRYLRLGFGELGRVDVAAPQDRPPIHAERFEGFGE